MKKLGLLLLILSQGITFYIRPEQGFSSVTQDVAEALCFNPRSISAGPFQSMFQYDSQFTTEDMYKMLKIDARVGVGFGPFKVEATSSYLRTTEESSLSISVHYFSKYWRDVLVDHAHQVDENLTEDGEAILAYGTAAFRTYCGDSYITSYQEGAMLIYTVKFTFSKMSEKRSFQAAISASVPFVSASASYTELFQKLKIQGTLSVSAHQVGGDPTKLSSALTAPKAFTDLAGCQEVLDGLYKYSQSFAEQIDLEQLEAEPLGTLHILGPYTTSSMFSADQIDLGESPVTPAINKAREWLTLIKKDLEQDLDHLQMLKEQGFTRVAPGIDEEIEIVKHNLQLLEFGLRYGPMTGCWYNLDYCLDIAREIKENLLPSKFDPKTIKLCNDPTIHGLIAHNKCGAAAYYNNGGHWIDGTYTNEIRIPDAGGLCTAVALGNFARRQRLFGLKMGTKRWTAVCAQISYEPMAVPENEYDWKKDRPERVLDV